MSIRIGCDLDNVLVDILSSARTVLARDLRVDLAEINDTGLYWNPFSHPNPELNARIQPSVEFWDRHDVLSGCQPLPGAVKAAWSLYDAGLLAAFITRRPKAVADVTARWLAVYGFPPVPVEHVGDPTNPDYFARCKSHACSKHEVTHMIDDSPDEAARLLKASIQVIMVDAPIGREARQALCRTRPTLPVVPDVLTAATMLIRLAQDAA